MLAELLANVLFATVGKVAKMLGEDYDIDQHLEKVIARAKKEVDSEDDKSEYHISEELAPNRDVKLEDFFKLKDELDNHDFYQFLQCKPDDGETNLKMGKGDLVLGKSA